MSEDDCTLFLLTLHTILIEKERGGKYRNADWEKWHSRVKDVLENLQLQCALLTACALGEWTEIVFRMCQQLPRTHKQDNKLRKHVAEASGGNVNEAGKASLTAWSGLP